MYLPPAMYTSNPVPQGGAQTSVPTAGSGSGSGSGMTSAPSSGTTIVPTAGSGSGSGSGTTNMPTADSTLEPTEEPAADPTTEPTETADPINSSGSETLSETDTRLVEFGKSQGLTQVPVSQNRPTFTVFARIILFRNLNCDSLFHLFL